MNVKTTSLTVSLILSVLVSGCTNNSQNESSKTADENVKSSMINDAFDNEVVLENLIDLNATQLSVKLEPSTSVAKVVKRNGKSSLAVEFLASENTSKLRVIPQSPWQLSKHDNYNFAFDVKNVLTNSVHFYLSLENEAGKYQSRSISIPGQFEGTVYFPLSGIEAETDSGFWGDALPWQTNDELMVWRSWRSSQVDLSTVSALNLFTIGIIENKKIEISDIRLRKNPATDPNWMKGIVDKFGQNALIETPLKINSEAELKAAAKAELIELKNSKGMPNRSQYGGYTAGPKLKATGYFRTEKVDGKWWMVDPDGYLFFSHGPANVRMANLSTITGVDFKDDSVRKISADEVTPEDSMGIVNVSEAVRDTHFVRSTLRNDLFEWLPSYDDPLSKHYSYRRKTHKGPVPHGETYSFYRANLERKYADDNNGEFLPQWHQVTLDRMQDWGFTSFGNWVDPAFYEAKQVPYFANGWIIGEFKTLSGLVNHWGLMPDPYDPVFAERARATINQVAKQVKASPWCAGIFIDNEKSWGEREGSVEARYGVILDALSKPAADSPAKDAFYTFLNKKYKTINKLNKAWNTDFSNWAQIQNSITFASYNDNLVSDLSKMLEMLGEQYFTVVHNTLAQVLPNHLYMGARMANWGMPDEIIKASIKYSDVLSFNIYEDSMQDDYWKFLEQVDLPVVVGEFHIGSSPDSGMYNPGIVHASDQKDRARKYKNYMQSILSKPYMVGAHWFQYVDEPITGRAFDGENANIGFVTVTDIPYPELVNAVKDVTSTMYQKRLAD
ncbi:beta-galactosidase [Algibacillus agarilyticus]|uniref:beta-galactosidase n=1 Tax=Algibacillus agarilyticus TaxID=2234133 RepID=UPI001E44A90C|nr:beta-galactosidase [Algibacillus agarilyticus]